jgi:FAD/FMN-containing dehydrogenase
MGALVNKDELQESFADLRGELITRGDAQYDNLCKVYNGMIHKRPAMIVRCKDVNDVTSTVRFARDHDYLLAIRGGGHNAGGLGVCDDGVVLDLSLMKNVQVNTNTKTVVVEGGCTWGEVDKATHEFGLATTSGIISTTGVGGLTLGGGLGHLARKYGLTIDNLLSADMVLADGNFVTVNEKDHPDLFWAIRGGGGNFGVITSFTFQLHPVKNVICGPTLWLLEDAKKVMQWYRDFITHAPEDLNGFFAFLTVPPGPPFPEPLHLKKMCGIVWCYTGPKENATNIFKPIQELDPAPAFYGVHEAPYPALQSAFDGLYPPGLQWYWKADFVTELSDEAIDLHIHYAQQLPTMHSTMHLYPINGAVHDIGKRDTAFSFREANWAGVTVGVDPDPANNPKMINWARDYWEALHPYSSGGAYINFMMEEGNQRIQETYRDNYSRLVEIKKRYDPRNLFRVNQNINPN